MPPGVTSLRMTVNPSQTTSEPVIGAIANSRVDASSKRRVNKRFLIRWVLKIIVECIKGVKLLFIVWFLVIYLFCGWGFKIQNSKSRSVGSFSVASNSLNKILGISLLLLSRCTGGGTVRGEDGYGALPVKIANSLKLEYGYHNLLPLKYRIVSLMVTNYRH